MKTISLECPQCGKEFDKALKEHTRQLKKNVDHRFYCSLRCFGLCNIDNLPRGTRFQKNNAFSQEATNKAKLANTKYIGEDKFFSEHIRRARNRKRSNNEKRECELSIVYLKNLWNNQKGKCAISNIPLLLQTDDQIFLASLGRVDSTIGYIEGNVQYVSCCINYAKNSLPDNDAHKLMQLICEHYIDNSLAQC